MLEAQRVQVCCSLGHPVSGGQVIGQLAERLDASYCQVATNFDASIEVCIDRSGTKPTLTMGNLDKLEEPDSLKISGRRRRKPEALKRKKSLTTAY